MSYSPQRSSSFLLYTCGGAAGWQSFKIGVESQQWEVLISEGPEKPGGHEAEGHQEQGGGLTISWL
jgi:hypothetical protein